MLLKWLARHRVRVLIYHVQTSPNYPPPKKKLKIILKYSWPALLKHWIVLLGSFFSVHRVEARGRTQASVYRSSVIGHLRIIRRRPTTIALGFVALYTRQHSGTVVNVIPCIKRRQRRMKPTSDQYIRPSLPGRRRIRKSPAFWGVYTYQRFLERGAISDLIS